MATLEQPTIAIYDGGGKLRDWLRAPQSVRVTTRWNEVGSAELLVQQNDPRADLLRQPGTRVQITLRGDHVLGGPVTSWSMSGPERAGWSFTVTDDLSILDRLLILPDPTKALDQQPTTAMTYPLLPAETVLKDLVAKAAPILGIPVDFQASRGLGPQVQVSPRWQSVAEVILPSLRSVGLGVSVRWQPTTGNLFLEVKEQGSYPLMLSPQSRTVTSWEASGHAPTMTRVYTQPSNSSTAQVQTNTHDEDLYGVTLRGATYKQAETADEAASAMQEALNDGAATTGMSITLSETPTVRYGGPTGLHVGDRVKLTVGSVEVTDFVREAVIEWSPGKALTVAPAVGGWNDSPVFALADAVRRIAATVKRNAYR